MTLLIPSRRWFLAGLGALLAAPAVVRADSLMKVASTGAIAPDEVVGHFWTNGVQYEVGDIISWPGVRCIDRLTGERMSSDRLFVVDSVGGQRAHIYPVMSAATVDRLPRFGQRPRLVAPWPNVSPPTWFMP